MCSLCMTAMLLPRSHRPSTLHFIRNSLSLLPLSQKRQRFVASLLRCPFSHAACSFFFFTCVKLASDASIWIWDFLVDVLLLFMSGKDEQTVEKHLIAKLFTPVPEEIEGYESSLNDKEDASFWYMQVNASTCDELDDFEEFGAIYDDGDVDEFCE
ncbi:hypothetical protein Tco_1257206 [Tanacetum coccineum]